MKKICYVDEDGRFGGPQQRMILVASELLKHGYKIDFVIPHTFKTKIKKKNISLCKVNVGGFNSRTKCLEYIPVDIAINNEELP